MSQFDLIVRSGSVIDGTGAPARDVDIAVKDGKITALGNVEGESG